MTSDSDGLTLRQAAEQAKLILITLRKHHPLETIDECISAISESLSSDCEENSQSEDYEAGYSHGYEQGFDNGLDIGRQEGFDRQMFKLHRELKLLRIDVERYKASAGMWRNKCYEINGMPLPWKPEELIQMAVKAERELIASWVADMCQGLDANIIAEAIRNGGNDAMDDFKVSK